MSSDTATGRSAFAARTRDQLRAEILEAAVAEVVARGWRGLRMQAVADTVGISRQTINYEFTDKQGLAHAIVEAICTRFLDEHDRIIADSPDLYSAIHDPVLYALRAVRTDPVHLAVMAPDATDTFLPLYTKEAAPFILLSRDRLAAALSRRFPELDADRLNIALEASTRQSFSEIHAPIRPPEEVARAIADLLVPYLTAPAGSRD